LDKAKSSLSLSCIGAGRAGKTLCKLLAEQHSEVEVSIRQVINRSLGSATAAVSFMGQGEPQAGVENLLAADIWL